jgi:hypothetical protein
MSDIMAERAALNLGAEAVSNIEPALVLFEKALATPEEKLLFWTGVFARLGGCCAASIGPGALEAIRQTTERLTSKVIAQNMN